MEGWRAIYAPNLTTPDDFWKLWEANQDVFAAIAQTEGAARSGGEPVALRCSCGPLLLRAAILPPSLSPPFLLEPASSNHTAAALTLLAWDVLTTLDDEVCAPSPKSDARI